MILTSVLFLLKTIEIVSVLIASDSTRREFKVFFFGEAAKIIAESKLQIKDFLAISKPKLFRDSSFSHSLRHSFNAVLIVGTRNGNQINNIFGKGRLMVRI